MKNNKIIFFIRKFAVICLFSLFFYISGCANQQPPGGGDVDKTPPKVVSISPKPNTVNFRGNTIAIDFNEYIDRRSFQDAFRISPQYKGDISYSFSGTSVEVKFDKTFDKINANKTFVVNINSGLTDIHGNAITEPINFAFATGSKIDVAKVSGRVYNNGGKPISILAYHIENEPGYDPTKNIGDYVSETNQDGVYSITNLAPGRYRMIALQDDDRNLLYTAERENYGTLPFDINLSDSTSLTEINFNLKNVTSPGDSSVDYTKFSKDSLGIVYTSIENNSKTVLPEQSIFIFFNKFKPTRENFVNSLRIADENNIPEKVVFNWKNDSLVEVFPANRFVMNKGYSLTFRINTKGDSVYDYRLYFRTVSNNSFGEMKGSIQSSYDTTDTFPVKLELSALEVKPFLRYSFDVNDTTFSFNKILEATYTLFAYIDKNHNGVYDFGNPFPFEYSEPFFVYPQQLGIKGGWTVENVILKFTKP